MEEIFQNIDEKTKLKAKIMADIIFSKYSYNHLPFIAQKLADFAALFEGEEADFIDFYFNMRMEQLKNEG